MYNSYNMKFSSTDFQNNLSLLKEEVRKANNLLANVNEKINKMPDFYQGKLSDLYLEQMNKFTREFVNVKTQTEKYIAFLNYVMEKYIKMEEAINKAINTGVQGLSINGSEVN